jgi:hypothetical protein
VGLYHRGKEQQGRGAGCVRVVPSGGSRVHVIYLGLARLSMSLVGY